MPWSSSAQRALGRLVWPTFQVEPQVKGEVDAVPPGGRICDLGAGGRRVRGDAYCVDLVAGPDIDLVADVHHLPLPDRSFNLVVCTGTLNVCAEPAQVIAEAYRILGPGGRLLVEVGFFQPYLPEPEDFWRFTLAGLRQLCGRAGFEEVRAGAHIGPVTALASSALFCWSSLFAGDGLARKAARAAGDVICGLAKYGDLFLPQAARARVPFAYGYYYVGRRPSAVAPSRASRTPALSSPKGRRRSAAVPGHPP